MTKRNEYIKKSVLRMKGLKSSSKIFQNPKEKVKKSKRES